MTTYTISYDLIKRKDYPKLWAELERLGAHRTLESYWLINVDATAMELADHFRQYIDGDDKIFVSEFTENHYAYNVEAGSVVWVENNPPAR